MKGITMAENFEDFKEIVRQIENKRILLPDFQREFVWKDEDRQKKIVASVLARMPIGSILLLNSSPDEYSSKFIGCKNDINVEGLDGTVKFLLDGQQRITVLTNVFSNVIHDQCNQVSDLISPTLKRRFFLRIPKWCECRKEPDLFGVHELLFKYQNPDANYPDFLSGEIEAFIECIPFLNNDNTPYNPQERLSTDLDSFCTTYSRGYLIPLFLSVPPENKRKSPTVKLRFETIIQSVSQKISDEIIAHFTDLSSREEKEAFVDEIFVDDESRNEIKMDLTLFRSSLEARRMVWMTDLKAYLDACIKKVFLNIIEVQEKDRGRAIDIYENLNLGGVSLNTFDLIMAKVAKVSKVNFYKRIINYIQASKEYSIDLVPQELNSELDSMIVSKTYNATINCDSYNDKKEELASKYIDAFLDVLSLYCYNDAFDPDLYKVDYIKRGKILELAPKDIDANCEKICDALDRALFFFQTRCGIRSIQELNYSLMLVIVATIFINDDYYKDVKVHNKLEAWYWASLFSGEFDKDQNSTMLIHLQALTSIISGKRDVSWIDAIKNNVFNAQNFSDKSFLLMGKVDEERYPKAVIRHFICQYFLARTYPDMFDSTKKISVFSDAAATLEAHHIIPLGSTKKVGESTKQLRNDRKNICNSPLNFVYITKDSNKAISDEPLDIYVTKINVQARVKLQINGFSSIDVCKTEEDVKKLLDQRFTYLEGDVKNRIDSLIH